MKSDDANEDEKISYRDIINALYSGILERPADEGGFESYLNALKTGVPFPDLIHKMIMSDEFQSRNRPELANAIALPDLTQIYPDKYIRRDSDSTVLELSSDEDFSLIDSLIIKNRYYDSLGVWAPKIDLDKKVTAAIVSGLGAQSCLELGCFSGSVLSILADQGIDVCGVDISHLAFVLAHANIHEKMRFGDLISLSFDRTYDVFLGMDILEHLNPLGLDRYLARIAQLIKPDGFAYINSPMFGADDVFGTAFEAYLPEWRQAGEDVFWRYLHCDARGWPMHGHLVWASPKWWESAFLKHGLVRDRNIEKIIHGLLEDFFGKVAPARRSLFVLKHSVFNPDVESLRQTLGAAIAPVLAG